MNSKDILRMVGMVVLAAVVGIAVMGYFGNKKAAIEADRAQQSRLIDREETAITEAQRTERTEERSQFWQKLIPYGEDETEDNNTDISTEASTLEPNSQ